MMREHRSRKPTTTVKFPQIKQKMMPTISVPSGKSVKLQRIGQKKNLALIDMAKINKIEKEFSLMTKRNQIKEQQQPVKKDQMRESRLLLLKDKTPNPKKNNQNLLSNLVMYNPPEIKKKKVNIPTSNISLSPTKLKKIEKPKTAQTLLCNYSNPKALQKLDFVRMFIIEELLYYINKTSERSKEQMAGFCKFYNENVDEEVFSIVSSVFTRSKDYLLSIFYEKLGFYIFLILGTDSDLQEEANFLLKSLMGYLHTNNLIILDLLMEIVDLEKLTISTQFHVYNTSRFNEDRRKISSRHDKMGLLAKNNKSLVELIKSILINCGFDSLKTFVIEILANDGIELMEKIKQVSMMLVSLDSILVSSLSSIEAEKPKPPFLPDKQKSTPYTLVLDMDETLIHYTEVNKNGSLLIRPYCLEFLAETAKYYELVIFTAAVKQYADSILDSVDRERLISHRLYRQHTRIQDYVSIKDISQINRDLSKTIIIDNIASNFKLQPRNGIAISTWTGDQEDLSLLNLIPVLTKLAESKVTDVRDGLETLSEYMQAKMKAGQEVNFDDVDLSEM